MWKLMNYEKNIIMNDNQNGFFYSFLLGLILFYYMYIISISISLAPALVTSFGFSSIFFFVIYLFALWFYFIRTYKIRRVALDEALSRFQLFFTMHNSDLCDFNRFNDTITRLMWLMWQHKSHLITIISMSVRESFSFANSNKKRMGIFRVGHKVTVSGKWIQGKSAIIRRKKKSSIYT